jgi:uncharacterized protein YoxC
MVVSLALQAVATAADTLIVRQVSPARTGFEQLVFVSSGLTSVLTLILLVVVIIALFALKKQAAETKAKLDALLAEVQPLAKDAKEMVAESKETVKQANYRVRRTVDGLTDQVDELTGMIAKVNRSASRVSTLASTALGGLKLGARAFGFGKKKRKSARQLRAEERAERPRLRKTSTRG